MCIPSSSPPVSFGADFPWWQLVGSRVRRVINDCGASDWVLLVSQFLALFTDMAGRTGFVGVTGNALRNRFSTFGHSGYFLDGENCPDDAYMRTYWVPLLTSDDPVPHFDRRLEGGLIRGVLIWLGDNAEPIKLLGYFGPLVGIIIWITSFYLEADRGRREAADNLASAARGEISRHWSTAPDALHKLIASQRLDSRSDTLSDIAAIGPVLVPASTNSTIFGLGPIDLVAPLPSGDSVALFSSLNDSTSHRATSRGQQANLRLMGWPSIDSAPT